MNKATATKVQKKIATHKGSETLGFIRYFYLSDKTRFNMKVSHYLAGNADETFTETVTSFFASLSHDEYKNWLLSND